MAIAITKNSYIDENANGEHEMLAIFNGTPEKQTLHTQRFAMIEVWYQFPHRSTGLPPTELSNGSPTL